MGLASGRVTFRRYRLGGLVHDCVDDVLLEKLNRAAFGRYGSAAADGVEIGWITPQHLFDVDFGGEKIAVGRFAHLMLRVDRNSPPAAIKRSYFLMEQAAALEASGKAFLTRSEQRQAKDAATQRAEAEARSGAFRRISAFPVLIDLERQALYFGSTSNGANDHLIRLFGDTFECPIEPVSAHSLAMRSADEQGGKRALEDARPAHFIEPPDEVDGDVYSLDPEDRGFFGREFLTCLWYGIERAEGVFELLQKADVAASLATHMQLKCDFNLTGTATLRCDAPARAAEARAALAIGKQPSRLGLMLAAQAGEWTFTLDGAKFDVSGLVLPPVEGEDKSAVLETRCTSLADLCAVLDGLFAAFMRVRLSGEWDAVARDIKRWALAGRLGETRAAARLISA
ncbi:MAG: hypothetical protein H6816_14685 [Phycisphaerales bacterium]|nr:hypothetical protein [Phycisphaerales bacterium]